MIRERTRPQWTPEEIASIYVGPHDARVLYPGHLMRVQTTIAVGRVLVPSPGIIADLACGNGDIANGIAEVAPGCTVILGDYAPNNYQFSGPIEENLAKIPRVDIMVLAETLEHLWEPDVVLLKAHEVAANLVCSVPVDPGEGQNGEHYWAFDREGFQSLLTETGWRTRIYAEVDAAPSCVADTYRCGIWGVTEA